MSDANRPARGSAAVAAAAPAPAPDNEATARAAATIDARSLLSVRGLEVAYGGIQAVKGIDLDVREGELVTLIGANGAGKTSTLKAITGLLTPRAGEMIYDGRSLRGRGPHELVGQGLAMVPEGRGVFARMTITENLQMGAYSRRDREVAADIERQFEVFPRLRERATQTAGTLSGGEQQMLAMARALMSRPRLLVLDEPSMGLSPIMVGHVFEVIREVHERGTTVLLVEQNARLALQAANRAYVMDSGLITMTDSADKMLGDPRVRAAYLGEG
jgi:branched-chain amino acid transport system ATP-binding protein